MTDKERRPPLIFHVLDDADRPVVKPRIHTACADCKYYIHNPGKDSRHLCGYIANIVAHHVRMKMMKDPSVCLWFKQYVEEEEEEKKPDIAPIVPHRRGLLRWLFGWIWRLLW